MAPSYNGFGMTPLARETLPQRVLDGTVGRHGCSLGQDPGPVDVRRTTARVPLRPSSQRPETSPVSSLGLHTATIQPLFQIPGVQSLLVLSAGFQIRERWSPTFSDILSVRPGSMLIRCRWRNRIRTVTRVGQK